MSLSRLPSLGSRALLLGPLLGLLAACGQAGSSVSGPVAAGPSSSSTRAAAANATAGVAVSAAPAGRGTASTQPGSPAPTATTQQQIETAAGANPSASPFPLSAYVTPQCVLPGGAATVHVTTQPGAIVAYAASYKGDKSGAPPPFGYGYGGNDHGNANASGQWENTWTVRADTPPGAAYVLVVAGYHQAREQVRAPFTVAHGIPGGC